MPCQCAFPHAQAAEALRGVERQLEAAEKGRRERLQEADDLRKRTRQERMGQLRAAATSQPLKALLDGDGGDTALTTGLIVESQYRAGLCFRQPQVRAGCSRPCLGCSAASRELS